MSQLQRESPPRALYAPRLRPRTLPPPDDAIEPDPRRSSCATLALPSSLTRGSSADVRKRMLKLPSSCERNVLFWECGDGGQELNEGEGGSGETVDRRASGEGGGVEGIESAEIGESGGVGSSGRARIGMFGRGLVA